MSESLLNPKPNKTVRAALLGAVAVLALGGALGAVNIAPQITTSAPAEAPLANASMPSFADTIQRVRGAVVSVKVNIVESANDEAGPGQAPQGMPRLRPGDPLERFFRRFGEEGLPSRCRTSVSSSVVASRRVRASSSRLTAMSSPTTMWSKNARARTMSLTLDGGQDRHRQGHRHRREDRLGPVEDQRSRLLSVRRFRRQCAAASATGWWPSAIRSASAAR